MSVFSSTSVGLLSVRMTLAKPPVQFFGSTSYPVDKIQWKPGWVAAPEKEVTSEIRKIMEQDKWLLDGWGPWETIEERFEKADTIIFVDHKVWTHLYWAIKRQFKALINPKSVDKPEGCNLVPMTWKMLKMIWMIDRNIRPKLLKLVESHKGKKDVFHIRSPKELKQFTLQQC